MGCVDVEDVVRVGSEVEREETSEIINKKSSEERIAVLLL